MTLPESRNDILNSSRERRWFAVGLTGILLILFLFMISGLLFGVIAGILLWTATDGLYRRLLKAMRGRRGAAAGVCVAITVLVIIIPVTLLVMLMTADAASLAQRAQEWYSPHKAEVEARIETFTNGGSIYVLNYRITAADVMEKLEQASGQIGQFFISLVQNAAGGVARAVLLLFVSLYALFFFYLDGAAFLDWLKRMLPLDRAQSERLLSDFFSTCKASLKTLIVIGFIQGSLGGLAFWVCGIPAPFFWTMLMAVASIIPAVGAQIILVPAGIFLIAAGKAWFGIGLLLWSLLVIANIDNLLRPYLVRREVNLHELLVFVSSMGGIATFGFFGVILGPVIAAMLKTSLQIYAEWQKPPNLTA